jgi:ribonuclease R
MFMVEANEAVAAILDKNNIPCMRRIHPDPDNLTMQNLSQLVRALGLHLPKTPDRWALQDLLRAVKGKDCSLAINIVVLRSLERARYSPLHIGHYALASPATPGYCHFTSPIRRYADLLVHRALDCYLTTDDRGRRMEDGYILDKEELTQIGNHITFTEERAEDAENELKTVLILQMLADKVGEELDCVVTGLTNFGVFVKSTRLGVEGLVQLSDLGPDNWQYNPKAGCIVGRHTGMLINLGQPMKVRIISVNVPARQLNVAPLTPLVGIVGTPRKGRQPKSKTGRQPQTRPERSRRSRGRSR